MDRLCNGSAQANFGKFIDHKHKHMPKSLSADQELYAFAP